MIRDKRKFIFIAFALMLGSGFTFIESDIINQLAVKLMEFSNKNYQEKVYVHTDADLYYSGDVVWLNTRLLDAQSHTPSMLSKVVHVKLFNSRNKELYHKKILVNEGTGYTDILLSDTLSTGIYYLSGYTEWMKNFSRDFFFHKQIYIVNNPLTMVDTLSKRKEEIQVDFFPEGGSFIVSMNNKVGFKISNKQGVGEDRSGFIINDRHDTIVHVNTYKYGIGSFSITPKKGRSYYLYLKNGDTIKKYMLPKAREDGLNLTVQVDASNNVEVGLEVSRKFYRNNKKLIFIAQCRGQVNFAAEGEIARKNAIRIPRSKLGDGINQLTVFDDKGIPLVERLIFVQPEDAIGLTISQLSTTYDKKELVEIGLSSNFLEDVNVTISVHDRPPMSSNNIINDLLLTSDLKGQIENPGYYFSNTDSAKRAADNLMLTHGWRRFVWDDVLNENSKPNVYLAENKGLIFRGKLINKLSGKAVTDTLLIVSILNKHPNVILYRLNGEEEFVCVLHQMYGKEKVFVNKLDEEKFNNFELVHSSSYDTFQHKLPRTYQSPYQVSLKDHFSLNKKEKLILDNYRVYKPELFSVRPTQPSEDMFWDSQYLGDPSHELYPDEYIPLKDLKEIIFELVHSARIKRKKGKDKLFVYKELPQAAEMADAPHFFYDKPVTFFVNGVPVFDDEYVFNLAYEDIYKVEIFNYSAFKFIRNNFYGVVAITTKNFQLGEKTDLEEFSNFFEFEGLSVKREFYHPLINNEQDIRIPDIRHLLYWNPDSTVKKDSVTTISFRTSDVQNEFYIKIEGITASGKPTYKIQKFKVD